MCPSFSLPRHARLMTAFLSLPRLDDVETKLAETEKEADKARKDSKTQETRSTT
jgi:hypothetical protein